MAAGVAVLAAAAYAGGTSLPSPAAAAACSVVTISTTPGTLVKLTVKSVTVAKGGCVEFANTTSLAAAVTVSGTSYREVVAAKSTTKGSTDYVATKSVTVSVTSGLRSGSATITVTATSPSPTSSSGAPSSTPTRTTSPVSSPDVAPSPTAGRHHHHRHHRKHRAKISLPPLPPLPTGGSSVQARGSDPVVAPGLTTASSAAIPPVATSSGETPVATVLEPAGGSGRGLPALIAIVLVAGLMAAYGRVLLSYASGAVDNRPSPNHRA